MIGLGSRVKRILIYSVLAQKSDLLQDRIGTTLARSLSVGLSSLPARLFAKPRTREITVGRFVIAEFL